MSKRSVTQALLRPNAALLPRVWVQRHPSGARVLLADGTESRELATAVAGMVAALPAPLQERSRETAHLQAVALGYSLVSAGKSKVEISDLCHCGDCLPCELASMRSRKLVRHGC